MFNLFKATSELDKKVMIAVYEFYKNKNDYYYDININVLKNTSLKGLPKKYWLNMTEGINLSIVIKKY